MLWPRIVVLLFTGAHKTPGILFFNRLDLAGNLPAVKESNSCIYDNMKEQT